MPKMPIQSWDKSESSEVMDYIMEELVTLAGRISEMSNLDAISALQQSLAVLDKQKVSQYDFKELKKAVAVGSDQKADKSDLENILQAIATLESQKVSNSELDMVKQALIVASNQIATLQEQVVELQTP
jgi:hypothetical protein